VKLTTEALDAIARAEAEGRVVASGAAPSHAVRINIPMPPTSNNLFNSFIRGGKIVRCVTKEYRLWRAIAKPILALMPRVTAFPVEVCILLRPGKGWQITSDVSNRFKAVEDTMVAAGVLPGDNQRYVTSCRIAVDTVRDEFSTADVWTKAAVMWW